MKIKYLCAGLLAALVYSCDDATEGIGTDLMPEGDRISAHTDSYEFITRSLVVDSVYARTNTAYLGRYTDPQFGAFNADFLAQFTCMDNFKFEETITEITGLSLFLQYSTFFGDSLNAMRMQIDTLSKVIPESDLNTFYTNVDPKKYYNPNAKPIALKAYSALGQSVADTTYADTGERTITQTVKLPTRLGQYIYDKYKQDPNNFKDPAAFIRNVLKGFYVQSTHGDGTILYIRNMVLRLNYDMLLQSSSGKVDSLSSRYYDFAATKEVIQANHFSNDQAVKDLAKDPNHTYLKSPAGIFTEAEFPIEQIYEAHSRDTLNAVNVAFKRYNEKDKDFPMSIPSHVLMVRKKDMYSFFEQNKITDNKTSFLSAYNSKNNSYTFSNIAPLITSCIEERKHGIEKVGSAAQWEAENPDWNKVVLIPVKAEISNSTSGQTEIVGISNNLEMSSAMLQGGTNPKNKLKMQIFYTTF